MDSMKAGVIKTMKHTTQSPYNILLVGETGVGKSSVLEFIANVMAGNNVKNYDFGILDITNEAGGSQKQSQTNSPRLYELHSKNSVIVSIVFS